MRDYQRQKNNKYILPRAQYHRTLWLIRDYYRLKEEAEYMIRASPDLPDGMPHGTGRSDPTAEKAIKLSSLLDVVNLIECERDAIPEEYRHGVWDNVMYGTAYPRDADRSTYGRIKSRFVYGVAKGMEKL